MAPSLPQPLQRLRDLAFNLWWSWNSDAMELFRELDADLWEAVGHNPVKLLSLLGQKRLEQVAADSAYLAHLDRVLDRLHAYTHRKMWFEEHHPELSGATIAYFSMEFGIHECLPVYSGGLGVLAGDHLKSASDLGLPLVGIGLLYRNGYFQQRLAHDGMQLEEYPALDYYQAPLTRVNRNGDRQFVVRLEVGPRAVQSAVWKAQVGRIPLYLLDTDLPDNDPADREITQRLYSGDSEMRMRQEIVLGLGGVRMLESLGINPAVCHMNEGHAGFLAVERIRLCMERHGLHFGEAREAVAPSHVFTTHTPVPAGIDRFERDLVEKYFTRTARSVGLNLEEFLSLGKANAADANEKFNMAVLALRLAGNANGVSELHGSVSREMWQPVWPGSPREEVPIASITNGVHTRSWISREMELLLDRYLGAAWADRPADHTFWSKIAEIPDAEVYRARERSREQLVSFARRQLREQLRRRGAPPAEIKIADECLDPEGLTIGFARRFAPYKRGALLFRDPERLLRLLSDRDRPVQIIMAGKAHPRDERGKEIIKQILAFARKSEFRRRLVFLENYDIGTARRLVQGCDVWLNNPIKPLEASGTSGMKVAPSGGLNMSVLDGWWPEAYDGGNGWAIGDGQVYEDPDYQNYVEGEAIYELLEKEIVPMFFDRTADGLPRRWIARIKASMSSVCPKFNTHRMIEEYVEKMYVPAARRATTLSAENYAAARELSAWKASMSARWGAVRVEQVETPDLSDPVVGAQMQVRAILRLDQVRPEEVAVELFHGSVDAHGQILHGRSEPMACDGAAQDGRVTFAGRFTCLRSGRHGFSVRVVPRHAHLAHRYDTGMVLWS
ncbi:MAG: alpha-glucan family phosphorylase [Phycisphaerae bacterium]